VPEGVGLITSPSRDALDAGAERAQALVDPLVAAVDLRMLPISDVPSRTARRSASPCPARMSGDSTRSPRSAPGPEITRGAGRRG
jgi:hypothetical protein